MVELNEFLKEFPPFEENQKLDNEELLDILEFSIPATWQKAMVLQGFNPIESTIESFIKFCERLEFTEDLDQTAKGTKSQTDPKDGRTTGYACAKSSVGGKRKSREEGNMCPLHLTTDHDANDCKVLQAQANCMQGM